MSKAIELLEQLGIGDSVSEAKSLPTVKEFLSKENIERMGKNEMYISMAMDNSISKAEAAKSVIEMEMEVKKTYKQNAVKASEYAEQFEEADLLKFSKELIKAWVKHRDS